MKIWELLRKLWAFMHERPMIVIAIVLLVIVVVGLRQRKPR